MTITFKASFAAAALITVASPLLGASAAHAASACKEGSVVGAYPPKPCTLGNGGGGVTVDNGGRGGGVVAGNSGGNVGGGGGSLPFTGADILAMSVGGGVLVAAGGGALVAGRRRRSIQTA